MPTPYEHTFAALQHLLPQHALSSLVYRLTRCRNARLKHWLIRLFCRRFGITLDEAVIQDIDAFEHFNAFFTRELLADARPLDTGPASILSPVDGCISECGSIDEDRVYQAKGKRFSLNKLLAADGQLVEQFTHGRFATIYLSPRDYHRIHMPCTATLQRMVLVPGDLFSVNPATVRTVDELFARNERLLVVFDTEHGPMVMILVGAIFVGSMETVWEGEITPQAARQLRYWDYRSEPQHFAAGQEMGRFNMGSTVILLFPNDSMHWQQTLRPETEVCMGQAIGEFSQ